MHGHCGIGWRSRLDGVLSVAWGHRRGCVGRVATGYGRAGNGHVPSMTTNVGSGWPAARSHVARDPPSIKTCAPGQRLWPDLGLRHMPEAPQEATEDERGDSDLHASFGAWFLDEWSRAGLLPIRRHPSDECWFADEARTSRSTGSTWVGPGRRPARRRSST